MVQHSSKYVQKFRCCLNHSVTALVGILFPTKKVTAFTVVRMSLGVGYLLGVLVPLFAEIEVSFWIEVSFIVIGLISYSVLLFTTHNREQLFPLCYYKKIK